MKVNAQEVIPIRKLIAMASTATVMLALTAAPAMAQTTQEGLVNCNSRMASRSESF